MEQSLTNEAQVSDLQVEPKKFCERSLEERKERFSKLLEKNPNKIPIVFDKHPRSKLPDAKSVKFISTRNLKLSYFTNQLRSALKMPPECALFFSSTKSNIVKQDALMGELYDVAKNEDGFLYLEYREVESFGGQ